MSTAVHTTTSPTDGQITSSARAAVDIVVVTSRDDFLLELGEALGGQASVTPVESTTAALAQMGNARQLQILMIDSRGLADIRAEVDPFEAQVPPVEILVFAEGNSEAEVAAALKGSKVFAVLPLPIDPQKTMAIFGGAVAESKAKRAAPPPSPAAAIDVELTPPPAASVAPEPIRPEPRTSEHRSFKLPVPAAAAAALAVLVVCVLWFFMRDKDPAAPVAENKEALVAAVPATPAVETSLVKGKVDELLEKARQAMRERRYTEPTGDNALLYYRSAAATDPANGEALDGLTRVGAVLATRFEEAFAADQDDEAATALAQFKNAMPNDARVTEFQSRLTKWRAELAREREEARQKKLAEEQAKRDTAAEAKKVREERAAAAETERQARLARDKAREEERKKAELAKSVSAPSTSKNSTAIRSSSTTLQSSLKRKRYVAPEYPEDALAKSIGGVVTITFTVDVKGEPQDIRVEAQEPAGVFDRAAIAAVRRWRYEPLIVDGVPTEVPARMAIRFAPPD